MKFIYTKDEKPELVFGNVEYEQFFVDKLGNLCQKTSHDEYHTIANKIGKPLSVRYDRISTDDPIQRFISHVAKIEF